MRRYRTVKFIAALIFLAALFYCLVSLVAAVWMARGGPGDGWGPGWRGWILLPVLVSGCFGAIGLLVFGAVLFFLTKIENNLAQAARGHAVAAPRPTNVQPPAVEPLVVPSPAETPPGVIEPIAIPDIAAAGATGLAVAAEQPLEQVEPPIAIEAALPEPVAVEWPAPVMAEAAVELESGVQVSIPAPLPEPSQIGPLAAEVELPPPAVESVPVIVAAESPAAEIEAGVQEPQIAVEPVVESLAPAVIASQPEFHFPTVEIFESEPEEAAASEVRRVPAIEVTAPKLEAALPEVELPQVEVAAPKLAAVLPEVALPQVEVAAPKLEAAVAAPDDVMALRAQLAALQARLAELEAQPAAVGIVPVSPEKLAAELPVKLPAAPDATQQPLATTGRLPGVEDVARIAAEMAALKPAVRHEPAAPTVMASVDPLAAEARSPITSAPADDLVIINGIGPTYARRLAEVGITTFAALAEASNELLDQVTVGLPGRAIREDWRGQARQLMG